MNNPAGRRIGLVILGLLSVGDMTSIVFTDGDHPPYYVAAIDLVVGLVCVALAVRAYRDPARPLRLLIGLRVLSAVTALPAFFVEDVPVAGQVAAAAIVALTAVGVLLTARSSTMAAVS